MEQLAIRLVDEVFNQGKLEVIGEIFAPDFIDHNSAPDQAQGPEGFKQAVAVFRRAFPAFRWPLMMCSPPRTGSPSVLRATYRGTHRGEFFGIAATGKQVAVPEIHLLHCAGDRIREHWYNGDDLALMQQLGVVKRPGQNESTS